MRLVNVYAPSVPSERRGFFSLVEPLLFTNKVVVLGGDFNVDLSRAPGCDLGRVVAGCLLRDAAVEVGGGGPPAATWANSRGVSSRLDYLFFPAGVRVVSFGVSPVWLSDHCLVTAVADIGVSRGPPRPWRRTGVWDVSLFV